MIAVQRKFVGWLLILVVFAAGAASWYQLDWILLVLFALLSLCLLLRLNEEVSLDIEVLSNLDYYIRFLQPLLIVALVVSTLRTNSFVVKLSCIGLFMTYLAVYIKTFPKTIRDS